MLLARGHRVAEQLDAVTPVRVLAVHARVGRRLVGRHGDETVGDRVAERQDLAGIAVRRTGVVAPRAAAAAARPAWRPPAAAPPPCLWRPPCRPFPWRQPCRRCRCRRCRCRRCRLPPVPLPPVPLPPVPLPPVRCRPSPSTPPVARPAACRVLPPRAVTPPVPSRRRFRSGRRCRCRRSLTRRRYPSSPPVSGMAHAAKKPTSEGH